MISHIFIGTSAFEASCAFYRSILPLLELKPKLHDPYRQWSVWASAEGERPFLIIGRPFDGQAALPGNGNMLALSARNRAGVDHAYARAIAVGASCEGMPRLRPEYHPHFYGCYFRDPDGNKICICCHEAP